MFMMTAKTLIKNRAQSGGTPAEILYDVNCELCEGNDAELFVTVWLAILEISTGKGMAANAGHEHPPDQSGTHLFHNLPRAEGHYISLENYVIPIVFDTMAVIIYNI